MTRCRIGGKMKKKKQKDQIVYLINSGKVFEAKKLLDDLIKKRRNDDFMRWVFSQRSADEKRLITRSFEYEEKYFKDLSLEEFDKELTAYEVMKKGKRVRVCNGFSQDFELGMDKWRFLIVDDLGSAGAECNELEKIITITRKHKGSKTILLHEMIHAFEAMLAEECKTYKQFLILKLYQRLKPKISNLMKLIYINCHRESLIHSVFFMLKSLDLDLRLKKPLGTVYLYGRRKLFAK